jgi:hypothetical protein
MISFSVTETELFRTGTQNSSGSCGLCFCNLLYETNTLVAALREPRSPGIEFGTLSEFRRYPYFLPGLKP